MELQTAKGVKDVPPDEKILQNQVVNTLVGVFQVYGFQPLETPILERYETLAAKFAAGEDSDALKEIFKLKDQGDRTLGLRFDLTVPLARYIAMNPNLKLPFKRYELGPVFRDGPIKAGRVRQFWQCDIDTVGSDSMLADAEIIALTEKAFQKLNLNVVIKVNNRKIINGILEQTGITEKENAIIAIDKLDKIGKEGVSKELKERKYTEKQIKEIFEYINEKTTLSPLKNKLQNEEGKQGIQELEELFNYLKTMDVKSASFDVSLARGLAYYTGTVYEVYLKKGIITSSLAAGGRWDFMIGKFMGGNREVPAVGGSFGLVPIMEALKEKKIEIKNKVNVLIIPINTTDESLKITQELREDGVSASFALGKKGVSKNLEYASTLKIPYVIIIGEDELKKKKVLLRDMNSGTQQLLTVKNVVKKLRK